MFIAQTSYVKANNTSCVRVLENNSSNREFRIFPAFPDHSLPCTSNVGYMWNISISISFQLFVRTAELVSIFISSLAQMKFVPQSVSTCSAKKLRRVFINEELDIFSTISMWLALETSKLYCPSVTISSTSSCFTGYDFPWAKGVNTNRSTRGFWSKSFGWNISHCLYFSTIS